jgi:hypothetical protein
MVLYLSAELAQHRLLEEVIILARSASWISTCQLTGVCTAYVPTFEEGPQNNKRGREGYYQLCNTDDSFVR